MSRRIELGTLLQEEFAAARASLPARNIQKSSSSAWVESWSKGWWLTGAPGPGEMLVQLSEPMKQHPVVYKCVKLTADNISSMTLEFFRKGTDTLVPENDPTRKLFARPAPHLVQTQFLQKIIFDLELYGNCFTYLESPARASALDTTRIPTRMRRLKPYCMRPKLSKDGTEIQAWTYFGSGATETYSVEEILHFYYPNPYDEWLGLPPLASAMLEANSDWKAALWNYRFFGNNATPELVFLRDAEAPTTPDLDEHFEESWLAKRSGLSGENAAAVLPPGMKAQILAPGHRAMSFGDLRRLSREQILMAFGIPPGEAGVLEFANYANMGPQKRSLWYNKLFPLTDYVETVFQTHFMDRFNLPISVFFKREEVLALIEDLNEKLDAALKLKQLFIPPDQINDRLELGFEMKFPSQKIPWVSMTEQPAELAANPPEPGPAQEEEDGEEDDDTPPPAKEDALARARDRRAKAAARVARALQGAENIERTYAGRLRVFLGDLEKEVLANLSAEFSEEAKAAIRNKQAPNEYFDVDAANRKIKKISKPAFEQGLKEGAKSVYQETGIKFNFDLLDPSVQAFLESKEMMLVTIVERLHEDVREMVSEFIDTGEPFRVLRGEIQEKFALEKYQAARIARTEVGQSFQGGRFEGMKDAGIKSSTWTTAGDAWVRDGVNSAGDHASLEGESQPLGQQFSNGALFPLDPSVEPEERINCRCVAVSDIEEGS